MSLIEYGDDANVNDKIENISIGNNSSALET